MEILKFKTNIASEHQLQKVASVLDNDEIIRNWQVDTSSPDNLLTVSGQELDPQLVENLLKEAGLEAEFVQVFGASGGGL